MLQGAWSQLVEDEKLRRSSHCLAIIGNQAWIFGGEITPRVPVENGIEMVGLAPSRELKDVHKLDTNKPSPCPRVGSAIAAINNSIYLFSGRGGLAMAPIEEEGLVWCYQVVTKQWSTLKPVAAEQRFPAGRSYHAVASDKERKLFIHAGCPEKGRLNDLWSFNVSTRTWTELPAAPGAPRGGTSLAYLGSKLYRMNGFDGSTEQGGVVDIFSLETQTWTSHIFKSNGINGPEPRSVSSLLAVGIRQSRFLITLFGERDPSSLSHAGAGKMLGDVWAFDIDLERWSQLICNGHQPKPRGWFGADVAEGQGGEARIVVHGGLAEDNSRLYDIWRLSLDFADAQ